MLEGYSYTNVNNCGVVAIVLSQCIVYSVHCTLYCTVYSRGC